MTKNPFINAVAALAYISLVALVMSLGSKFAGPDKSIITPIAVMSLFTLSAASMAYIFGFYPFQLYFDGKKKQAISLVFKTIVTFGAITLVLLALLFSGFVR